MATPPHPLCQAFRLGPQENVALRMGNHRTQTGELKFVQRLVHRGRNRHFIEFHKHVIFLVDAKMRRVLLQSQKILRIEMKIASGRQRQSFAHELLQCVTAFPDPLIIKRKYTIGVGSSNHMRDSVGDRGFRHEQRLLDGLRPIIESRQNVTMQINHKFSEGPQRHQAETACHAPNANIIPERAWRIRRGSKCFANSPPRIPPTKIPGISSNPVRQET